MDNEGFRIPRRFVARDAVDDELERLDKAIAAAAAEIAHNRDAVAARVGREVRRHLRGPPANAPGLAAPQRAGGDDPPAALLARVRRQPHAAPLRPGLPDAGKLLPGRAGQRHLRHREAAAAAPAGPPPRGNRRTSPRRCSCWPTTSRPAKRPISTADFVRGFVTEIGGPGSHTAIVAEALEIPAVVGTGPFLTEVSGGDLVIIDGDQGLVILQPDEETLARYRHEAEEHPHRWPPGWRRSATCPPKPPTASASNCWATSSFPTRSTTASTAGPTASACTAPSSSTSAPKREPDEEGPLPGLSPVVEAMGEQAGGDPHLRPGRRQDAAACRRPRTSATRVLGLRSIRLALRNLPMFRTQLRAILRASALGNVRDHVPADLHAPGAAAGEDGAGRRDGGPRGARHRRSTATCRWA